MSVYAHVYERVCARVNTSAYCLYRNTKRLTAPHSPPFITLPPSPPPLFAPSPSPLLVGECEIYKEERDALEDVRKLDVSDMEKFGRLESSEKTTAILGDTW